MFENSVTGFKLSQSKEFLHQERDDFFAGRMYSLENGLALSESIFWLASFS